MGIKERVHKKLVEIDNSLLKELEKAEKKYGKINISSDEVEKIANHYVQKMTDKTIDLTLQEVKEAIEKFDLLEILIKSSDPLPHYKKGIIKSKRLDFDVSKIEGDITVYDSLFKKELKKQLGIKDD